MERKINFPKEMSIDVVDFIDQLMQLNPLRRLGCGPKGSSTDFAALKRHPFFNGLNFERLANGLIKPPIPVDLFKNAINKVEEPIIAKDEFELFVKPEV